jgi:aspartate beta-hydroxylase
MPLRMPATAEEESSSPIYDRAIEVLRGLYDRRISGPPVLDPPAHFPGHARFAAAAPSLREEAMLVAKELASVPRFHELMPQQASISNQDKRDWRLLIVKAYGATVKSNAQRCPALARLVAADPDVLSAALSFLAPGKKVPEHRGPFRGVLRYYLGLSVPPDTGGRPGAVLTIDGIDHRIATGQALLWDDTYPHAVRNDTPTVRIALLLDIRRHGMPLDMEILSRVLITVAGAAVRLRRIS